MIKTNELMLGNLVEYKGKYYTVEAIFMNCVHLCNTTGVVSYHDINPIELTDEVLNRLGENLLTHDFCKLSEYLSYGIDSVHKLQIDSYLNPIDITPLLKPKPILTTHDGVEVFEGEAIVYVAYEDATNSFDEKVKDKPYKWVASDSIDFNKPVLFFSTESACQSYIDQKWAELHPEPIFVTEDGVKIYKGMKYCYCPKEGYTRQGNKCKIIDYNTANEDSGKRDDVKYFSTIEITEAYLNRTWAKAEADKLDAEYQSLLKSTQCQKK